MHCWACGHDFEGAGDVCPRCHADLSVAHRTHALHITFVYVLLAIALVSILTLVVLQWHDAQILQTLADAKRNAG